MATSAPALPEAGAPASGAEALGASLRRNRVAYLFMVPTLIALAVIVFYPLIYGITLSFTNATYKNVAARIGAVLRPATWDFVGLQNYIDLLTDPAYKLFQITGQTIFWTVTNVTLHFLIGLLLAILLNRKIRGRSVYRVLLLIPWAVPAIVSAYAWLWLFNTQYGFFNLLIQQINTWTGHTIIQPVAWGLRTPTAWFTVIATNVWLGFPFMMVTLLGGLQSIPGDLYEAASIDGAGAWQQFRGVTLPLLKPVAVTATLLGAIWTFNVFVVIYIVTGGGPNFTTDILATFSYNWGITRGQYAIGATYAVFILVMLLMFSAFYRRLLTSTEEVY